jgi:hypothetical protein
MLSIVMIFSRLRKHYTLGELQASDSPVSITSVAIVTIKEHKAEEVDFNTAALIRAAG